MTAVPFTDLPFVKGHGTENDFVLVPDRDGRLHLTAGQVRAICDRRAGIGGDGLIRVAPATDGGPGFFMDYRNADGSPAEMCGNGARVFARALVDWGWQPPGRFDFQTRGGRRTADLGTSGDVTIGMGPVVLTGTTAALVDGTEFRGTGVSVGNPHLVCSLPDGVELAGLDLDRAPAFDPAAFPDGVNIEFVHPVDDALVDMRVYERGVGETRSCGTGTVAVAAAHLAARRISSGRVTVRVPGGTVVVELATAGAPGAFSGATLTGPAVLVASGTLAMSALAQPVPAGA